MFHRSHSSFRAADITPRLPVWRPSVRDYVYTTNDDIVNIPFPFVSSGALQPLEQGHTTAMENSGVDSDAASAHTWPEAQW